MGESLENMIERFKGKQVELMKLDQEFQVKKQEYVAELKAAFGITDGEQTNTLQIVEAIVRIQKMT